MAAVVQQRMSAALIAAAGLGKTVVLRLLRSKLPEARFQVRYVKITGPSKRDLCKEIAVACGLEPAGIYPALVRKLQDAFIHTGNDGLRPVILFDEAHDLRPEALIMLRLLTNFEMDSRLVVSVILCGQPPLATLLARPEQAVMAQRLPATPLCACSRARRPAPTCATAVRLPAPQTIRSMRTPTRASSRSAAATCAPSTASPWLRCNAPPRPAPPPAT